MRKGTGNYARRMVATLLALLMCLSVITDGVVFAAEINVAEADTSSEGSKIYETEEDIDRLSAINDIYNSTRTDIRDETIYSILITRFYDGDTGNNVHCWDDAWANNPDEDPAWRGDFKGLVQKLDYVQALGFTTICLTPVVKNASGYDYYGNHPINFSEIDARYESEDFTYQDVINACHERGLKVIQGVVLNSTGSFGEENLYPIFERVDFTEDINNDITLGESGDKLGEDYLSQNAGVKYQRRIEAMKATDMWRTQNSFSWDDYTSQIATIAGDCWDLNTENPVVYNYLVEAYTQYIEMGVDGFWVKDSRYISRLVFNKVFNDAFINAGIEANGDFVLYGDGVTRYPQVWYMDQPGLSNPFYTWDESDEYEWSETDASINEASAAKLTQDNANDIAGQPTSNNAFLDGNAYHAPDYSEASGMYMNDFQFMWVWDSGLKRVFENAIATDKYYNDATYNMLSLEDFDYGTELSQSTRMDRTLAQWQEQLALMFTFRGVPMVYHGTELEFQVGQAYDAGPNGPLSQTIRAYFGDCIEGSLDLYGPTKYGNATGNLAEALESDIAQYIQRLNRVRRAVPALRKGQYSVEDITYQGAAFKKRYTDESVDSFALVAISGDATFSNIPNGTYVDAMTGDVQNVTNGELNITGLIQGDLRVYVLSEQTKEIKTLDAQLVPKEGSLIGNCNEDETEFDTIPGFEYVEVTGIEVNTENVNIYDTESVQITANVLPENATNKKLIWKSADESVATVSDGLIVGVSEGTTTIRVSSNRTDIYKEIRVNVTNNPNHVYPETIVATPASVTLNMGESQTISATITPENVTKKNVTWMSYDELIATVDENGQITAVSDGMTSIVGKTVNGKKVVVPVTVGTSISLDDNISVDATGSVAKNVIYYTGKPDSWGNSINVYGWDSSGAAVFGGWPGTAMSYDEALGMYYAECDEAAEPDFVIFNDGANQTADLSVAGNCYNGTTDTWSDYSTEPRCNIILDYHALDGVIFSRKILRNSNGEAYISEEKTYEGYELATKPENANGVYSYAGSVVSYVYDVLSVTGVTLDKTSLTFAAVGETETLTATVSPTMAANKAVKWESSDSTVATVSESGVVTAVANGTATITVTTEDGAYTAKCEVIVDIPEPVDPVEAFVSRMYTVVLGRDAEETGLNNWVAALGAGTHDGAGIAKEFVLGEEFKMKNLDDSAFLDVLYKTFFNREADADGKAFWMSVLEAGNSREFVLSNFVNLDEFTLVCASYGIERGVMLENGEAVSPGICQFVKRMYTIVLGRDAENEGLYNNVLALVVGALNAEQVTKNFFTSEEYLMKDKDEVSFVSDLYSVFMNREADEGGLSFWVSCLEAGMTREDVLSEFAKSEEFKMIAASYGLN